MRSDGARRLPQPCSIAAALIILSVTSFAAAEEGPGDCLGIGFDVQHPITIAKVIADRPQVHFIKSAADDPACRQTARLAWRQAILFRAISFWSARRAAPIAACRINPRPIERNAGRWAGCHRRP